MKDSFVHIIFKWTIIGCFWFWSFTLLQLFIDFKSSQKVRFQVRSYSDTKVKEERKWNEGLSERKFQLHGLEADWCGIGRVILELVMEPRRSKKGKVESPSIVNNRRKTIHRVQRHSPSFISLPFPHHFSFTTLSHLIISLRNKIIIIPFLSLIHNFSPINSLCLVTIHHLFFIYIPSFRFLLTFRLIPIILHSFI